MTFSSEKSSRDTHNLMQYQLIIDVFASGQLVCTLLLTHSSSLPCELFCTHDPAAKKTRHHFSPSVPLLFSSLFWCKSILSQTFSSSSVSDLLPLLSLLPPTSACSPKHHQLLVSRLLLLVRGEREREREREKPPQCVCLLSFACTACTRT